MPASREREEDVRNSWVEAEANGNGICSTDGREKRQQPFEKGGARESVSWPPRKRPFFSRPILGTKTKFIGLPTNTKTTNNIM